MLPEPAQAGGVAFGFHHGVGLPHGRHAGLEASFERLQLLPLPGFAGNQLLDLVDQRLSLGEVGIAARSALLVLIKKRISAWSSSASWRNRLIRPREKSTS